MPEPLPVERILPEHEGAEPPLEERALLRRQPILIPMAVTAQAVTLGPLIRHDARQRLYDTRLRTELAIAERPPRDAEGEDLDIGDLHDGVP